MAACVPLIRTRNTLETNMGSPETQANLPAVAPAFSCNSMLMDPNVMDRLDRLAETMCSGKVTVPAHLRGSKGDCFAIAMQAAQWGMNPFAVAQKTHLVNGHLGYEAQLVIAVVQASGAINSEFSYEYRGDGDAMECRVGAVLRGNSAITWGEWLRLSSVTTRNSPLWKTNPKQQLGYLQAKNWARLYAPGAILGVYSADELESGGEIDMGAAEVVGQKQAEQQAASPQEPLKEWPQDVFDKRMPGWRKAVQEGKSVDGVLAFARTKGALSAAQEAAIRALAKPEPIEAEFTEVQPQAQQDTAQQSRDDFLAGMEEADHANA
jgi:hypothetical protein